MGDLEKLAESEELLLSLMGTSGSVVELLATMDAEVRPQLEEQCDAFARTVSAIDALWVAGPSKDTAGGAADASGGADDDAGGVAGEAASLHSIVGGARANVFLSRQAESCEALVAGH